MGPDLLIGIWNIPAGSGALAVAAAFSATVAAATALLLLRRQLDHDREMRDRDELRKVLDDCLESIMEVTKGLFDVGFDLKVSTDESDFDDISQRIDEVTQELSPLPPDNARLRLRLPDDDPVVDAHDACSLATVHWRHLLRAAEHPPTDEQREGLEEIQEAFTEAIVGFVDACRDWSDAAQAD